MRNFLVIVLACLSSLPSHAGIYSFGGGCASMGAWSKAALSQADTISRVVQTLKDNPDCKGIESILPKISIANDALAKIADDGSGPATKRAERMESLPAELGSSIISSVRNVLRFTLATRGVLLAFAKIHLPSCSPLVCDNSK